MSNSTTIRNVKNPSFASSIPPKNISLRSLATGRGSKKPRFVPRGQRPREKQQNKKKLTEVEKKLFAKALKKKDATPNKKHKIWSDDPTKLWAYRKQWMPEAAKRVAPLIAFGCLIGYSETARDFFYRYCCPLQMEMLYGASMLPTIHPYGDTWLHTTPLWDTLRTPYHVVKGWILGKSSLLYQKGDIVVFRDPALGRRACKRIVGVEGDVLQRYGEHVEYYSHRPDRGIRWETLMARGMDPSCPWDNDQDAQLLEEGEEKDENKRTLVVPPNHVWVEGDNPLVCVDSRHYGPVPVERLEGRVFWRLFPLLRDVNIRKYDQRLRREPRIRPPPLDVERLVQRGEEDILATYYNLYRITPKEEESPPPEFQQNGHVE